MRTSGSTGTSSSSSLRGRELVQPRFEWKRQPNTYLNPSLGGVFTLFLHRLRPESDLADAARARLLAVTKHVADGKANLDFALAPRDLRRARDRTGEGRGALRARARAGER